MSRHEVTPNEFAIDALMSAAGAPPIAAGDWTLPRVAQAMVTQRSECVVVCEGRVPTGVVSEADIARLVADGQAGPTGRRVARDVMWPPLTVARDASLAEATALVGGGEARRLVVVNRDGTFAGLLTESDLLRAELRRLRGSMHDLVLKDDQLEVWNRRAMEADLLRQHKLVERHGGTYSVVLFDVDGMSSFNDRQGFAAGSAALRRCVKALVDAVRVSDRLYRFDGQAIVALLPATDRAGALRAAHRMRRAVESLAIPDPASAHGSLTISAGAACCDGAAEWGQVLARAERGLALAKQDGRNAVRADVDVEAAA